MATVRGTAVIRYGIKIVPALGRTVRRVMSHIETFQREIHRHRQFTPKTFRGRETFQICTQTVKEKQSKTISKRRKYFQKDTNNQYFRELLYREGLGAFSSFFAFRTGRFLVSVQRFLPGEVLQALRQSQLPGSLRYGQGKIPERIESHRTVTAMRATQRRFQLTHENVHYFRVVHAQVSVPRFSRFFRVAESNSRIVSFETCRVFRVRVFVRRVLFIC